MEIYEKPAPRPRNQLSVRGCHLKRMRVRRYMAQLANLSLALDAESVRVAAFFRSLGALGRSSPHCKVLPGCFRVVAVAFVGSACGCSLQINFYICVTVFIDNLSQCSPRTASCAGCGRVVGEVEPGGHKSEKKAFRHLPVRSLDLVDSTRYEWRCTVAFPRGPRNILSIRFCIFRHLF